LKKLKISFAVIFVTGFIALIASESVAYPPFLFKARKFGAKDCTFCHINPEGGPPWNDRGKWLIQEKEKRKADQVDVEWLASISQEMTRLKNRALRPQSLRQSFNSS